MSSINPYAPPKAAVADSFEPGEAAPALWNPRATANWCLLFTPVFGALLQMRNWRALGRPEKAAKSKSWAIASAVVFVVILCLPLLGAGPSRADGLARLLGLGLLITWYYANGKEQHAYVLARYGKTYPKKSWWKPLGWGVLGYVALFVVGMVGAFVAG